ncbi:MAG TPA: YbaY family lipoprotein [Burkholderiales bacterium]|nr:YbaY family lipoprotein [Burkholderiales bacterium]
MRISASTVSAAALAAVALAGCANFPPQPITLWSPPPRVTGTVFYRYVEPLPASAVVDVKLVQSATADQPETVVSEQNISSICNFIDPPCNGPVFYELPYDPEKIDAAREYRVSARILDGDRTLYASDTPNRVLTGGHARNTQILVAKQP